MMILHVDMDAFYASVEERDRPELRGQPVVVGGTPEGRGVVSAANYAARRFGIHSAMPAGQARRLCPHAHFLPGRHDYYGQVSRQIREIFLRYTPLVEPLSLDEAFLDVTQSQNLFGPAADIGRRIKREIRDELHLTASVGVAASKFLAKIASDVNKPDGFVVVVPGEEQRFLDPLPVSRVWGVGKVGERTLHSLGIKTIAQLRRQPRASLQRLFGAWGDHLWQLANALDMRPVVPDSAAKSISHETTFATDIAQRPILRAWLMELTDQVARRVRRAGLKVNTVQIKIRFGDFKTITRAHTLPEASDITRELWQTAVGLLDTHLPSGKAVRLLGMGVSGLEKDMPRQADLFADDDRRKQSRIDAVSDSINQRFGAAALHRATDLKRG